MAKSVPATAKVVRSFLREHPDLVPADVTVGSRGRFAPSLIEVFNAKSGMEYAEGNTDTVTLSYTVQNKRGANLKRTAEVPVAGARLLAGDLAGKRGRLSKTALDAAGEAYAASL